MPNAIVSTSSMERKQLNAMMGNRNRVNIVTITFGTLKFEIPVSLIISVTSSKGIHNRILRGGNFESIHKHLLIARLVLPK
jgi:hypothetical protein